MISNSLRDRALKAASSLPVSAGVLQKTLALYSRQEDLSIPELAQNIEQDVVIGATILSIANSAMYAGRSSVSSLRPAIARIGINKTRNALLGMSVTRRLRSVKILSPDWSLQRFNAHSLASAALCDLIVRSVRSTNAEWAFVAGLFHDIGLLAIAAGLPDEFAILMKDSPGEAALLDLEQAVLGFTHFELGADLISAWNCPAAVRDATLSCRNVAVDLDRPLPLGAVVKSATVIADCQQMPPYRAASSPDITGELLEALEIGEPARFIANFRTDYNDLTASAA